MKRSNDRSAPASTHPKKAPAARNIPTPDSDDDSSLFVPEPLRDPRPHWTEPLQEPGRQNNLVDYSSESSSGTDEDELEIVYAQDVSVPNRQTQPTASSCEQRHPVRPASAANNAATLEDLGDVRSFATPTHPHISRMRTNSSQPSKGKQTQKDLEASELGAQSKRNVIMGQPPPKNPKPSASTTQAPRKKPAAGASAASQRHAAIHADSSDIVRKAPPCITHSESDTTPQLNHRTAPPFQPPSPTTPNIPSSPASSTTSTSGGPRKLNRSLLMGHIQAEREKKSQSQPTVKPRSPGSREQTPANRTTKQAHIKPISKPSEPASPVTSVAKPQFPAGSAQSSTSNGGSDTAQSLAKSKQPDQATSPIDRSATRKEGAPQKQAIEGSRPPKGSRSIEAVKVRKAAISADTVQTKEHSGPASQPLNALHKPSIELPDNQATSKVNPAATLKGAQHSEPASRVMGRSSSHSVLSTQTSGTDAPTVSPGATSQPVDAPEINGPRLEETAETGSEKSAAPMSEKIEIEATDLSSNDDAKKRKALKQSCEEQTKKAKVDVETAASSPRPLEVSVLQIRKSPEAIQNDKFSAPAAHDPDEYTWEYVVYQKSWSTDERQSSTSLFFRYQNLDEANDQAERLYKHTDAQHPVTYSIKFKGWRSSIPNNFGGVCYQGVYIFIKDPTQLHHLRIWVSRNAVQASETGRPTTEFVTKSIYVLRLFKLYFPEREAPSDNESDAGSVSSQPPTKPIRQYQPVPVDEAYTILDAANRAAKDLHVELSFKPLPKVPDPKAANFSKFQMDRKFQEGKNRKLNDKLHALDPTMGGVEGCWESEFDGLDGEKYELKVEKVGLSGPRNL
ncbi:hypothetical protein BDV96DRAFT_693829 [Lophiotrema nucula]|uniref:Uncharacterized protein n=1 Tax=Lophiotrema nucula TaxID=690887 RepID=A0A6A5YKS2_9PLEO|nr:hypothetical protein BDV96DRAFT_693829 [Lophiotrema nucula]